MSYQLGRLDLVVNNATTQITVNTSPSTQSYVNGSITPSDNIINVANSIKYSSPDDQPAATISTISKASNLINLTATEIGTTQVSVLAPVAGNGLQNSFTTYYDGSTVASANVQLLTCFGANSTSTTLSDFSSNNFTITNNGGATVSSSGPFSNSYAYASMNFDGSTQHLSIPSNAAWQFNLNDFTIECWFYWNGTAPGSIAQYTLLSNIVSSDNSSWDLQYYSQNWRFAGWNINFVQGVSSSFVGNTWNHIAITRSSNTMTLWLNGVVNATGDVSAYNLSTLSDLKIGWNGFNNRWNGQISNVRIVKGVALYTGAFTPPTSNLGLTQPTIGNILGIGTGTPAKTRNSNVTSRTSASYEPLDIKLYDKASYNTSFGQNRAQDQNSLIINSYIAPSANKNVVSSTTAMNVAYRPEFYINGSDAPSNLVTTSATTKLSVGGYFSNGSYLTTTGTTSGPLDLAAGAGNWTIECWFYATTITGSQAIFWKGGTTGSINPSYALWLNAAVPQWIVGDGAAGGTTQNLSSISAATWYHFALVRNGNVLTPFVNGVPGTSVAISYTHSNTANNNLSIGNSTADGSSKPLTGYVSNLRIVKGVAVYTGAFIPPTTLLTAVTNTKLLLNVASSGAYLTDSSTNNYSLAVTGNVTYNASTPVSAGGSLLFDQSTISYLTVPSSTAFDLTGDFTIQAWVNMTTLLAGSNGIIDARVNGGSAASWIFHINGLGQLTFYTGSSYSGATTIPTGVWVHVAAVRYGSKLTLYLNGRADYTNAAFGTGAISPGATSALIGSKDYGVNAQYRTINYIANLQFVNGTALYTQSSFTVPASPLTATQTLNQNGNASSAITGTQTSLLTLQSTPIADNSTFANAISIVGSVPATFTYTASVPSSVTPVTSTYYVSTSPSNPVTIKNVTKDSDPRLVSGYFTQFIPAHTGEEDKVQAWI